MQSDIDIQITLFQIIEEKIKDPDRTTAEMMELLCIEKRSLRNRQRGTTYLTGPEFYRLARHFDIRLYDIELQLQQQAAAEGRLEKSPGRAPQTVLSIDSNYMPLLRLEFTDLQQYIDALCEEMEILASKDSPWIKMVCSEVPLFHLVGFEQLAFFKIFMYYHHIVDEKLTFEEFLRKIKRFDLSSRFRTIFESYAAIDSEEIWDRHTFEKLLRLIHECNVYGKFEQQKTVEGLLAEVDELVKYLNPIILEGKKIKGAWIELYDYESVMREGITLIGVGNKPTKAFFTLFMLQNVSTTHTEILSFLKLAFHAILRRSNLIVKSSNRLKSTFLNLLSEQAMQYRNKILKIHE
ncbi:hypothetical protein D7322_24630 [Sphingobacterium puteale]|uniref:Transcription regulator BetR N-terminal domain-containing protein n=1 Tax=Sphingobacterium puteale TaxID=2420510 RepID=A0A420VRW6_9SPHI|nr:hypothetical protein [Sphingobacterium puteale]RKO68979.1 hypothetical protein D7322_24630 [Sphingobacterium puteale]